MMAERRTPATKPRAKPVTDPGALRCGGTTWRVSKLRGFAIAFRQFALAKGDSGDRGTEGADFLSTGTGIACWLIQRRISSRSALARFVNLNPPFLRVSSVHASSLSASRNRVDSIRPSPSALYLRCENQKRIFAVCSTGRVEEKESPPS